MNLINTIGYTNKALYLVYGSDMRQDHYDGEHSLYRLAAYIPINTFIPYFYDSLELKYILAFLDKLPVRPSRVFVDGAGGVDIDWYPNKNLVTNSKLQYVQLLMEFQLFLQENSSIFFSFELQEQIFEDDPNERITGYPTEGLNFNPKFDATCFGSEKAIEVIRC